MQKIAIITGAAGGIGTSLVHEFIEKGYKVVAVDVKETDFNNPNVFFQKTDLKNAEEIKTLFSVVKEKFGTVHVLINNAGILYLYKSILEVSPEELDSIWSVNLRASFLCCKEFIILNKGQDYGRIINISSTRWHQNEADCEVYGASKGGIVSLTNSLCVSLSDTPITVNAISPGWIEVVNYEALTEENHKQHPSGRVGKGDDIARACLFLADEQNDFINGINLIVDGGMTKKMIYI